MTINLIVRIRILVLGIFYLRARAAHLCSSASFSRYPHSFPIDPPSYRSLPSSPLSSQTLGILSDDNTLPYLRDGRNGCGSTIVQPPDTRLQTGASRLRSIIGVTSTYFFVTWHPRHTMPLVVQVQIKYFPAGAYLHKERMGGSVSGQAARTATTNATCVCPTDHSAIAPFTVSARLLQALLFRTPLLYQLLRYRMSSLVAHELL